VKRSVGALHTVFFDDRSQEEPKEATAARKVDGLLVGGAMRSFGSLGQVDSGLLPPISHITLIYQQTKLGSIISTRRMFTSPDPDQQPTHFFPTQPPHWLFSIHLDLPALWIFSNPLVTPALASAIHELLLVG